LIKYYETDIVKWGTQLHLKNSLMTNLEVYITVCPSDIMRIIHCLSLMAVGGQPTTTIKPRGSKIVMSVTSGMIKISRTSNEESLEPVSHCQAFSLRFPTLVQKEFDLAVDKITTALESKEMPCWDISLWYGDIPDNAQVHAVRTNGNEYQEAGARQAKGGYNCELLVGRKILTSFEFSKTFETSVDFANIRSLMDRSANRFCLSVYDFLWQIGDLGTYIVSLLPVPESAGSGNAISTDSHTNKPLLLD
jgi:hypothetical protein